MPDKYAATWVSHSSISDYLQCPRAYFLKNVYKDPGTGNKIKIMTPALALGSAVHDTLESLSVLPADKRFAQPLQDRFEESWKKVSGKRGGFESDEEENRTKNRGREMIRRVQDHPGPLKRLAVKIQKDLPWFWLSEDESIILCGRIDWLEYLPDIDSVHIIDFKTGKREERTDSLQLPIYHLLVAHCQKRSVTGASYWYLARDDEPQQQDLSGLDEARKRVSAVAQKVKLARQLKKFDCPKGQSGCFSCKPFEAILSGQGEHVGQDDFGADIYIATAKNEEEDSIIL